MKQGENVRDVIVVGAGLSGLVAAGRLAERGLDVEVLEARDRVGGRTEGGVLSDGTPVELGGQWIGPPQDAVLGLIDELGLETFTVYDEGESVLMADGTKYTGPEDTFGLPQQEIGEFERVLQAVDDLSATIDLSRPWTSAGAGDLDRRTLDGWLTEQTDSDVVRRFYEVMFASLFAAETDEMSLLHFLFYMKSGGGLARLMATIGGAQESRVLGGTHRISERLAERTTATVTLNTPVRAIRQFDDHVEVEGKDHTVSGRRVIVALPPTLAARLDYEPALPPKRDSLTQQMPAGSVIKFQVGYDRPFWRDDGFSGGVLSLDDHVGLVYDNCQPGRDAGVLVAFMEGDHARMAHDLTPEQRRDMVLTDLTKFFGERAAHPFDVAERDWSREQYTRGCYGGRLGTGAWTRLGPALTEPVGRIHWAGAETASTSNGYMDGAIRSGYRAADEAIAALG